MTREEILERARQRRAAREQREQQAPERGSFVDPLMQGVSFGFADELGGAAAGVGAMMRGEEYGPAYQAQRDRMREDYRSYQERNPATSLALEIGGALPTAALPMGPLNLARAQSLRGAVARGAGAGAATGAVYEFGQGEGGAGNRAASAAQGFGSGAVIGGGMTAAGAGLGRGLTWAGKQAGLIARNPAEQAGIPPGAQRFLNRSAADDDVTLEGIQQRLNDFGGEAMPMDATPSWRTDAERLVQYGRPGSQQIQRASQARKARANQIVAQGFDEAMGPRPDAANLENALRQRIRQRGQQAYAAAQQANAGRPVNVSPFLEAVDEQLQTLSEAYGGGSGRTLTPLEQELRRTARNLTASTGDGVGQVMDFDRVAQEQKRLNKVIRDLSQSSDGLQRNMASELKPFHDMLVGSLDEASSGMYRPAMQAYRGENAIREAFEQGARDLTGPIDPSYVREKLKGMSPEELDMYRQGARSAIGRMLSTVRGGTRARNEILTEGTAIGEKVRLVLGDDAFRQLSVRMEGAQEMAATDSIMSRAQGARTARVQGSRHNPDHASIPVGAGLTGLAARGVQEGVRWAMGRAAGQGGNPREMSRFLSAQGTDRDRLVQALIDSQRPNANAEARKRIVALLANPVVRGSAAAIDPERDIPRITVRPRP